MSIEWDDTKSRRNLTKHGISFDEAALLLEGDGIELKANVRGEPRRKVITRFAGEYFAIVIARLGQRTRIISARHATPAERSCYDRYLNRGV